MKIVRVSHECQYMYACTSYLLCTQCLLRTISFLSINYTLGKLTKTFAFIQYNILLFLFVLLVIIQVDFFS